MHTRCCEKCSFVVHCFGAALNSTELIEASIDMWNTLDIAPNVPRWYEDQVKNSHCVIVLASNKMSLRCQNAVEEGDDRKYFKIYLYILYIVPWVPEGFLSRFPVSVMSLLPLLWPARKTSGTQGRKLAIPLYNRIITVGLRGFSNFRKFNAALCKKGCILTCVTTINRIMGFTEVEAGLTGCNLLCHEDDHNLFTNDLAYMSHQSWVEYHVLKCGSIYLSNYLL